MGQFSVKTSGLQGSHLSGNQHPILWARAARVISCGRIITQELQSLRGGPIRLPDEISGDPAIAIDKIGDRHPIKDERSGPFAIDVSCKPSFGVEVDRQLLDLEAPQKALHEVRSGRVDRYRNDFEWLRWNDLAKPLKQRKLAGARRTPCRPKVYENRLATKQREIDQLAIDSLDASWRQSDGGFDERKLGTGRPEQWRGVKDRRSRALRARHTDQCAQS